MKINKELVEQYKQIILEVGLPPIEPPEPEVQDTSGDEFMMSMGPPRLPGGIPGGIPSGQGLDFMKTWEHMPAWLRGVKNYDDYVRRWTERLPKQFRQWFPVWDDQLWDLINRLGILPENIIWTPMVVIVNGRPVVRYIPFGRSSDGKLYLLDGNWRDYVWHNSHYICSN